MSVISSHSVHRRPADFHSGDRMSRAIDLGGKRRDYTQYGVLEYLVLSLADRRVYWFDLRQNRELQPDPDGILKLRTFPGLWIDRDGLLALDLGRLMTTLEKGLLSEEHAKFVASLAQARGKNKPAASG